MKRNIILLMLFVSILTGCGALAQLEPNASVLTTIPILPEKAVTDSRETISESTNVVGETVPSSMSTDIDSSDLITVKFYCIPDGIAWYYYEKISAQNMLEETNRYMKKYAHVIVSDIWYDEDKICVDLDLSIKKRLGMDPFVDEAITNMLVRTFSSYPRVEEVELLVGGQKGRFGGTEVFAVGSKQSFDPDWKTSEVRFYYDRGPEFEYEYGYQKEVISKAELIEDTKKYMLAYNGIKINNVWYDGQKICVDLDESETNKLDAGSAAGRIETYILLETFSSYPNVAQIEILIGGQKGRHGDHFYFDEVFEAIN